MTEELAPKAGQSYEDLIADIRQSEPDYNPADDVPASHPLIKVRDTSDYPEIKIRYFGKVEAVKVLDTPKNLEWLLAQFGAVVRYNLMSRRREVLIPDLYVFQDDVDNDILARVEYIATLNELPTLNIDKWLNVIAGENSYHPIVATLNNEPWDGISRIEAFLDTLKTTNPVLDRHVIKTWMIAAVAASCSICGFTQHGVLVLHGKQGIGKTQWVRRLDPTKGAIKAIRTGALLDPRSKDSLISIAKHWIVELGELDATLNKTDVAHLKAYITQDSDFVRLPYARKESEFARRTAYIATVNNAQFLVDETGNRRWWTVEVEEINYSHDLPMAQIWGEVKALYDQGAPTYLETAYQMLVDENNINYERIDPLHEQLLELYAWDAPYRRDMTVTQVLQEIGYAQPSRAQATQMGTILTKVNGKKGYRSNGTTKHKVPSKQFKLL